MAVVATPCSILALVILMNTICGRADKHDSTCETGVELWNGQNVKAVVLKKLNDRLLLDENFDGVVDREFTYIPKMITGRDGTDVCETISFCDKNVRTVDIFNVAFHMGDTVEYNRVDEPVIDGILYDVPHNNHSHNRSRIRRVNSVSTATKYAARFRQLQAEQKNIRMPVVSR